MPRSGLSARSGAPQDTSILEGEARGVVSQHPSLRNQRQPTGRADLAGDEYLQALLPFTSNFDRFDLEDVRWYYESYRQNWRVSSNSVIQRIQRAECNIGETLHATLFAIVSIAEKVRHAGPDLRIEIRDEVHSTAVPWELLAGPQTGEQLALTTSSFVRALSSRDGHSRGRCLSCRISPSLLISRPGGGATWATGPSPIGSGGNWPGCLP